MSMAFSFLIFFPLLLCAVNSSSPAPGQTVLLDAHADVPSAGDKTQGVTVNLRIEGKMETIFEGPITTTGHDVTINSGTYHCDGTNGGASTTAGPTCTSALDDAASLHAFTWDGTYFASMDDFVVERINGTTSDHWRIYKNFDPRGIPKGGCQVKVASGDQILFASDGWKHGNKGILMLAGRSTRNGHIIVTVTNGTRKPVKGASVWGQTTNKKGKATLTFRAPGLYRFKARKSDWIRSNALVVVVE